MARVAQLLVKITIKLCFRVHGYRDATLRSAAAAEDRPMEIYEDSQTATSFLCVVHAWFFAQLKKMHVDRGLEYQFVPGIKALIKTGAPTRAYKDFGRKMQKAGGQRAHTNQKSNWATGFGPQAFRTRVPSFRRFDRFALPHLPGAALR
eukprot:1310178-Pyramimonas_sp.AAC.1